LSIFINISAGEESCDGITIEWLSFFTKFWSIVFSSSYDPEQVWECIMYDAKVFAQMSNWLRPSCRLPNQSKFFFRKGEVWTTSCVLDLFFRKDSEKKEKSKPSNSQNVLPTFLQLRKICISQSFRVLFIRLEQKKTPKCIVSKNLSISTLVKFLDSFATL